MFAEAKAAHHGGFKGYIKPFIHDLKMHSEKADARKGLGARIKEAVIDVTAAILKNSKTKNVANRIPFEGRFENPHAGIWEAVVTILEQTPLSKPSRRASTNPSTTQRSPTCSVPPVTSFVAILKGMGLKERNNPLGQRVPSQTKWVDLHPAAKKHDQSAALARRDQEESG